jgi:NAD(P)-dependent dehydrogenase (short-subunit alcohol dehydrogenase family)
VSLLHDQVAFVTGGADGIGLAVARRFAAEGARVMVADVRADVAQAAVETARADGLDLRATAVDVTDEGSVETALDDCARALGPPQAVVANAGILALAPAVELGLDRWRRVLDVNLTGAFLTARASARRMTGDGTITFTSSVAGVRGLRDNAAYSASKFGVVGLAQVLANELAASGVRVNAVCPGQIDTSMLRQVAVEKGVTQDELVARVPLGRPGTVDEVADAFVWLASPLSRYVTGQAVVVDGGWTLT